MKIIDADLKFSGSFSYTNTPQEIVIHHAESKNCTIYDIHSWHLANGWIGIGYHFFIRKDGSVYRGRPEGAQGSHCPKHNSISLGVCFEGDFMEEVQTQAQTDAFNELVKYIRAKYGELPIYGHKDLYSTSCPGDNFPLDQFKNVQVNKTYKVGWDSNDTGWYYITNTQGWYYKDSWQLIEGQWYSFDSQGYARRNAWLQDGGKWYYLKDNCMMAKNEWIKYEDKSYYLNEHGEMLVNTTTPDGYKVDNTGALIK